MCYTVKHVESACAVDGPATALIIGTRRSMSSNPRSIFAVHAQTASPLVFPSHATRGRCIIRPPSTGPRGSRFASPSPSASTNTQYMVS